jgi:hypothetical protein
VLDENGKAWYTTKEPPTAVDTILTNPIIEKPNLVIAGVIIATTVEYAGNNNIPVYRGGGSFKVKPGEIRIDKATGLVKDTHGISLDVNPDTVSKFGGAYKIDSMPEGLKIIQRGSRAEHFEMNRNGFCGHEEWLVQ